MIRQKKDNGYSYFELQIPANLRTWRYFLEGNYRVIVTSLLLFLIFFGMFSGNVIIFNFVIRFRYLVVIFLFWSFLVRIDSRVATVSALFLFGLCSVFLMIRDEPRATLFALNAFSFLVIGVFLKLVENVQGYRVPARGQMTPAKERSALLGSGFMVGGESEPVLSSRKIGSQETAVAGNGQDGLLDDRRPKPRTMIRTQKQRLRLRSASIASLIVAGAGLIFLSWSHLGPLATGTKRISQSRAPLKKVVKTRISESKKPSKATLEPETREIDKSRIKVDILNGNGMKGEAARVADFLKQSGFDTEKVDNARSYNYPQTELQYKEGRKDFAELVAKTLSQYYPTVLKPMSEGGHSSDVVVVLGKDRKTQIATQTPIDKSSTSVDVLNGNGVKGSAKKIANDLKTNGFKIQKVSDAGRFDHAQTIIQFRPGKKEIAEQIAEEIQPEYSAILKEDTRIPADIAVVLGKK